MILGVMSDTHGNLDVMRQVADYIEAVLGATVIFHLGDDYRDAVALSRDGHDVRMVPGLWCPEYGLRGIPKYLVEDFDGITVACAHAEKDLRAQCRAAGIILVGHTHQPRIQHIGWSLYVNPGHLKDDRSRGARASYAVVEIAEGHVRAAIHNILGAVVKDKTVPRNRLA